MIVVAALVLAAFILVTGVIAAAVVIGCGSQTRPQQAPIPVGSPRPAVGIYEQDWNRHFLGVGVYGLPAPAPTWPGMWVGPAVQPETGPHLGELADSPYEQVVRQRRRPSVLSRHAMVHGRADDFDS